MNIPRTPRDHRALDGDVDRAVAALREEYPGLAGESELGRLQATGAEAAGPIGSAGTLHLDDQSGIGVKGLPYDWSYVQDRARVRARDGDVVASSHPPPAGYERYCQDQLGLGQVVWMTPHHTRGRTNLASHCWTDRAVRRTLIHQLRTERLRCLHPLMGSRDAWQLAQMLHAWSRRPLTVVAPRPALTRWVNDKIEFAALVRRVLGEAWIPATRSCASVSVAAMHLRELAASHRVVSVKLPDAVAGIGNLVMRAADLRGRPLAAIRADLHTRLRAMGWSGERQLLVSACQRDVVSAPSAQLWIPPPPALPVVEGIFEQIIEGDAGEFAGCRTSELPTSLENDIVDRCWLLGRLFQQLGYVGRCSFDLVVVGSPVSQSHLKLIECNGRWGGASLPMTLVNRLLPPARSQPYVVSYLRMPSASRIAFPDVLDALADLLFDVRTRQGRLVLFNPQALAFRSSLRVVAFGGSSADAHAFVEGELRERLLSRFGEPPERA